MKTPRHSRSSKTRGGLLLVLVVSVLLITVAVAALGITTSSARQSTTQEQSLSAQTCAENTVALTIAELQSDPRYGLAGHNGFDRLVEWPAQSGQAHGASRARLTFSPDLASRENLLGSLNNLEGETEIEGVGRKLPPHSAQLIAVAEDGARRQILDCLVGIPDFPYVVVSSGRFESRDHLLVGQLPEGVSPSGVGIDDLLPAHLAGNDEVAIYGSATVLGDVQSAGDILGDGLEVRGVKRPNDDPVAVPTLHLEDLRPAVSQPLEVPQYDAHLTGFLDHSGDLTINGRMFLHEALLYVDGDVTVKAGIEGVGVLLCTGNLDIQGQSDFGAKSSVALFAEGDLTLGGARASSKLRGMLYSRGDVRLKDVTLIGSLVNDGQSPEKGNTSLDNVGLLQDGVTVTVSPVRVGYAYHNLTGDLTTLDDPAAEGMLVEASFLEPGLVKVVRTGFHPMLGKVPCGEGVVRVSDGSVVSGDLGESSFDAYRTAIYNNMNTSSNGFWISPINALRAINVKINLESVMMDFAWAAEHFQAAAQPEPVEIEFNNFLAPRDRLRVLDWRLRVED